MELKRKIAALFLFYVLICLSFCFKNRAQDLIKTKEFYFEFTDYYNCLKIIYESSIDRKMSLDEHRIYQNARVELDEYPMLLKEYRDKVKAEPNDYISNYLWGRLLILDPDKTDLAIEKFKKTIKLNPVFPWGYSALAQALINQREFAQAKQYAEECIRTCGDFIPAHITINYCIAESDGPIKAIKHLEQIIQKVRPDIELDLRLANLYILINETQKAEHFLEKIRHTFKNDYRYHRIIYTMTRCANSLKRRKRLLYYYWKNYPNSPNIVSVFSSLFDLYKQENITLALGLARNALNYRTRIKRLSGIAFKKLMDYYQNKGSEELEKLGFDMLNAENDNPYILNELGELLLEKGKIDVSLLLFNKAIDSCNWGNIKNVVYFGPIIKEEEKEETITLHRINSEYNIGKALYAKGYIEGAIRCFEKICSTDNVLKEDALIYLAKCHIALRNNSEAMNILSNVYAKYGSKRSIELINSISEGSHDNNAYLSMSQSSNDNSLIKNDKIKYLLKYRDKIILLGLHTTSCNACLRILNVIRSLENEYRTRSDIVFINIFGENDSSLSLDKMIVNSELFKTLANEFNIKSVPTIFIIDKDFNIRFRVHGIVDEKTSLEDLRYKIDILLGENK